MRTKLPKSCNVANSPVVRFFGPKKDVTLVRERGNLAIYMTAQSFPHISTWSAQHHQHHPNGVPFWKALAYIADCIGSRHLFQFPLTTFPPNSMEKLNCGIFFLVSIKKKHHYLLNMTLKFLKIVSIEAKSKVEKHKQSIRFLIRVIYYLCYGTFWLQTQFSSFHVSHGFQVNSPFQCSK